MYQEVTVQINGRDLFKAKYDPHDGAVSGVSGWTKVRVDDAIIHLAPRYKIKTAEAPIVNEDDEFTAAEIREAIRRTALRTIRADELDSLFQDITSRREVLVEGAYYQSGGGSDVPFRWIDGSFRAFGSNTRFGKYDIARPLTRVYWHTED